MQIYAILDWTSSWVPKAGYSYGTWMVYNRLNMPMIKQNNLIDALLRQGEKHRSFNDLRTKATGYGWQPWREHETWICSYLMVLYGVVSVLPLTLQALSRQWPVKLGNFNGIQIPTHTHTHRCWNLAYFPNQQDGCFILPPSDLRKGLDLKNWRTSMGRHVKCIHKTFWPACFPHSLAFNQEYKRSFTVLWKTRRNVNVHIYFMCK